MEKYTVEEFKISLPYYMSKTGGLNNNAAIQFRNMVRDISGYVIKEEKTVKLFDDPSNKSINDVYDEFIKDFLASKEERKITSPINSTNGTAKFLCTDLTYLDDETMIYYYHFIGIVETSKSFYKIICSSTLDNKNLYKKDFQKIFNSITD
ncbi:hypothetical protein [Pedobacter alpinus]|uniref:Uncharacterized protein n=1 Tax=Pedobacter alpinus TaxID=1590643 RepID=A0ABW5TRT2_9SPHI